MSVCILLYVSMYGYIYDAFIYIYMYIYRERERESREREGERERESVYRDNVPHCCTDRYGLGGSGLEQASVESAVQGALGTSCLSALAALNGRVLAFGCGPLLLRTNLNVLFPQPFHRAQCPYSLAKFLSGATILSFVYFLSHYIRTPFVARKSR